MSALQRPQLYITAVPPASIRARVAVTVRDDIISTERNIKSFKDPPRDTSLAAHGVILLGLVKMDEGHSDKTVGRYLSLVFLFSV